MLHVLNPVVIAEWLSAWGYLGVFICVFIGNLGVPVPEETVLLTAGFLAGLTSGRSLAVCGRMASIAAAEIISHYGARPETDLRKLMPAG